MIGIFWRLILIHNKILLNPQQQRRLSPDDFAEKTADLLVAISREGIKRRPGAQRGVIGRIEYLPKVSTRVSQQKQKC